MSLGRRQGAIEQHVAFVRSTTPNGRVLSLDYVYTRNAAGQVTESKGLAVPAVESGSESSTIDATNNQLAVRGGTSYSYDAAGRLLSDGIRSFGWDALGRLKTVRRNGQELAGYGYDSQNRRVRKTVGAKTTYYLYDLESRLIAEIAGNGRVLREYVWLCLLYTSDAADEL